MFWKNIRQFFKQIWAQCGPDHTSHTSLKFNTTLDTIVIKIFGQEIKVSREIPINGPPYELTVVLPRAEWRNNSKTGEQEIILSSITIAHSPRHRPEEKSQPAKITIPHTKAV
ncbi:MAG TPA: hypothetical protein DDW50_07445 [Firmicutes bacterium]|jgi:hypothetical protein|nr:hypothetical protein [Bacillota bacterium]